MTEHVPTQTNTKSTVENQHLKAGPTVQPGPEIEQRIISLPTIALIPNPGNARKHPKKQVNKVAASIREFGFINPVIVDENDVVLVGHCRLEAATLLGLDRVPVIWASWRRASLGPRHAELQGRLTRIERLADRKPELVTYMGIEADFGGLSLLYILTADRVMLFDEAQKEFACFYMATRQR
jgi:ParB-like nuclease domain